MTSIRLRTLTKKSLLNEGKYAQWTVEKLLQNHSSTLLYWYYIKANITFNEEVLNELKSQYPKFIEIDKPGVVEKKIFDYVMDNFAITRKYGNAMIRMKKEIVNTPSYLITPKQTLMLKNHGH